MAFLTSNLYSQFTRARGDDIFTTTLLNVRREIIDQVFNDFVTWFWLRENNRVRILDGGEMIKEHLSFQKNTTAEFYSMYGTLTTTPITPLTSALYEWKEAAVTVAIARKEERQNSGKHQILPLLQARIDNARMSLVDVFAAALYATTQVTNTIESLDILIDATSTVGGIDRTGTGNGFWQATVTASGSAAAQLLSDMRTAYNDASSSAASDAPDLITTTQSVYESYEGLLTPQQRFSDSKLAAAGFESLKYKQAAMVFDDKIATGRMYFINSKYIHLNVDSMTDFAISPFVKPYNQVARWAQILWMGNVTTNRPGRMVKLTGITA